MDKRILSLLHTCSLTLGIKKYILWVKPVNLNHIYYLVLEGGFGYFD